MKKIILMLIFLFSHFSFAAVDSNVTLRGRVLSYDKKIIEIQTRTGPAKVLRQNLLGKNKKILKGDMVSVKMDFKKLIELNSK